MISLPILFNTDESNILDELDITTSLDKCIIKEVTFYNIVAIHVHVEDEKEYSLVHTANGSFVCSMKYKELKAKLQNVYKNE